MNKPNKKKLSKEEIMAAINDCAAKLGRTPTFPELKSAANLTRAAVDRHFANYSQALFACGLEPEGPGCRVPLPRLLADLASVIRGLGEVPTMTQYELASKYTRRPLLTRFGVWSNVPEGILQYAEREKPEGEWEDVLELLRKHCREKAENSKTSASPVRGTGRPVILDDRPVYGEWLNLEGLAHAPVNEAGVLFLFGMVAARLGFVVTWIGTEFPDSEAMREVAPGQWQRVRIEFEFRSRNFLYHRHDPTGCDLIVCWENNWPESPLEVLELKKAVSNRETLGN